MEELRLLMSARTSTTVGRSYNPPLLFASRVFGMGLRGRETGPRGRTTKLWPNCSAYDPALSPNVRTSGADNGGAEVGTLNPMLWRARSTVSHTTVRVLTIACHVNVSSISIWC